MIALRPDFALPEHRAGEPRPWGVRGPALWGPVLANGFALLVALVATATLWPLYGLFRLRYARPPVLARWSQVRRYLVQTWTVRPGPPGLSVAQRVWLSEQIVWKVALFPVGGLAWLVDEMLDGRALDAVHIERPIFEISAGRSGSTQLARYLEADPALVAPSLLQFSFPYRWLWRLVGATLGRVLSRERVTALFERALPAEFRERHEGDPFRTDTYDAALYLNHLNPLGLYLGGEFGAEAFSTSTPTPQWEEDFVRLLQRTGQKLLLDAPGRRLFVKGHFLAAADALERQFPDAQFLTMIRRPEARFQSAINYLRANPIDMALGPVPWSWLTAATLRCEIAYCHRERAWFGVGRPNRCVVRFDDYVRDLQGTMERVYRECIGTEMPPHVPRTHPPRRRHTYLLDRSLPDLGVDPAELRAELVDYEAWCAAEPKIPRP